MPGRRTLRNGGNGLAVFERFCIHQSPVALCAPCSRAGLTGADVPTVARALGARPVPATDPHDPDLCPGCRNDAARSQAVTS